MRVVRYVTHPEVAIDLSRPVHSWPLSEVGRARAGRLLQQPWLANTTRIVCSTELKALETARIVAEQLRLEVEPRPTLGENDRSATGPLPAAEFEQLANRFFAEPDQSVRGWESARAAQSRISAGLADLLEDSADGDTVVIGHGGVGTLWYCQLAGLPIDRRYDQPSQGHYFSVAAASGRPLHHWRRIDDLVP